MFYRKLHPIQRKSLALIATSLLINCPEFVMISSEGVVFVQGALISSCL